MRLAKITLRADEELPSCAAALTGDAVAPDHPPAAGIRGLQSLAIGAFDRVELVALASGFDLRRCLRLAVRRHPDDVVAVFNRQRRGPVDAVRNIHPSD